MINTQNPVEKMQPRTLSVSDIPDAIHLVRSVVMKSALDCECRDKVDAALQQLEAFEQQRNQAKLLAMAREERRKIGILLDMLGILPRMTRWTAALSKRPACCLRTLELPRRRAPEFSRK